VLKQLATIPLLQGLTDENHRQLASIVVQKPYKKIR